MNKVILMGRLTRDPNVRYTQQNGSQEAMCVARYTPTETGKRYIRRML